MLFKVINILFALLFLLAAILQYNDPDPYIWMPIYLYAAICCALASARHFYPRTYIAGIIILGLYACYLFFTTNGVYDWLMLYHASSITETMIAEQPWIEQTREFFGLLIIIASLLLNYYFSKRNKKIIAV
jgi:hypothetical protein